jgi:hypothetical protein
VCCRLGVSSGYLNRYSFQYRRLMLVSLISHVRIDYPVTVL